VADGKWINDLTPEMPLLDAARNVLFVRLQVVRDYLPKVVYHPDEDPEYVHQLRVGTRRSDAAVSIFRSCLSDKAFKGTRGRLRVVRRAAGSVRDWDVFLIELRSRFQDAPAKDAPGLDFLIGFSLGQRNLALTQLQATGHEQNAEFESFITNTIMNVRLAQDLNGKANLVDLARPLLSGLREELEQLASGDLNDYPHLHQVRIAGKRLRYAMEIFADCFPPSFKEELYPQIEAMQEILGRANDSHLAYERLAGLRIWIRQHWAEDWKRLQPGIEGLLRYHQRRLPQERRRFLQWWEKWGKHGSEELLTTLVGVAAR
jgi:CHAD domain-containing protein